MSDDLDSEEEKTVLKFIEKQKMRAALQDPTGEEADYEEVFGFEDDDADTEILRRVQ